jgi:hypothetical protein
MPEAVFHVHGRLQERGGVQVRDVSLRHRDREESERVVAFEGAEERETSTVSVREKNQVQELR